MSLSNEGLDHPQVMVFEVGLDPLRILKDDFIIMLAHRNNLQKAMLIILEVKPQRKTTTHQ